MVVVVNRSVKVIENVKSKVEKMLVLAIQVGNEGKCEGNSLLASIAQKKEENESPYETQKGDTERDLDLSICSIFDFTYPSKYLYGLHNISALWAFES
ncbi:hypothetical protein RIF29_38486 [Crotalaria pallida]|uniref:Uncharacterized protein n=1 Tax=Crotalaria pallida TaxID=3830 RepID=A0AAN9HNZ7_CROPI